MNQIKFNQTGGFPLSTNILDKLQENYQIFSALGSFAGELGILTGCEELGGKVTPGVMMIKGEVIYFEGGLLSDKVIVIETYENKIFEDGASKPTILKRVAQFGNSLTAYLWADFYRVKTQKSLNDRIKALEDKPNPIPLGLVAIWNKPSNIPIPQGWQELTDLAGKVPVGLQLDDADFGTIGQTGGATKHQLTQAELPNYDLRRNVGIDTPKGGSEVIWGNHPGNKRTEIMNSGGQDQPHNNLQPYKVVQFIEYVG